MRKASAMDRADPSVKEIQDHGARLHVRAQLQPADSDALRPEQP